MSPSAIIKSCKEYREEHGFEALLILLEDIIECQAQESGVEWFGGDDQDEMEVSYFTAH